MKQHDIKIKTLPEDNRLDKVIAVEIPELSRSAARRLVEQGAVYVNQKRCKIASKGIRVGDLIRIFIAAQEKTEPDIPIIQENIIFEDDDLIIVNKPPHLPTHATLDDSRHHLVLALQNFLGVRDNKNPKDVYLGVHHRLDRDTSGIILFTKRKEANANIAQAFQNREVHKIYLAVSGGALPEKQSFTIKSFIGQSPRNKRLYCSVLRNGKYAETEIKILQTHTENGRAIHLIQAEPLTGRTHQIRVHLSENKLPILGDATYGLTHTKAARLLLHAWRLKILGKEYVAPLPSDFQVFPFTTPSEP